MQNPTLAIFALSFGILATQNTCGHAVDQTSLSGSATTHSLDEVTWSPNPRGPWVIESRRTLDSNGLSGLIRQVAPVARDAPLRYPNFEAYLKAANLRHQRTGKVLEAVLTERANRSLISSGSRNRLLATAAEGFPTHPADLAEIGPDGMVTKAYQSKFRMGYRSFVRNLGMPKYDGMVFVTTRESFHSIQAEFAAIEARSARRGISPAISAHRVRTALDEGRLATRWYGKPLPTARGLDELTRRETQKAFEHYGRLATSTKSDTSFLASAAFKKLLIGGDVVVVGYAEYADLNRYVKGRISGVSLGLKAAVRSVQASLTAYALYSPEPMSKVASGVTAVALITADLAVEFASARIEERRAQATRNLLIGIDRDERYHAARARLSALARSP